MRLHRSTVRDTIQRRHLQTRLQVCIVVPERLGARLKIIEHCEQEFVPSFASVHASNSVEEFSRALVVTSMQVLIREFTDERGKGSTAYSARRVRFVVIVRLGQELDGDARDVVAGILVTKVREELRVRQRFVRSIRKLQLTDVRSFLGFDLSTVSRRATVPRTRRGVERSPPFDGTLRGGVKIKRGQVRPWCPHGRRSG